MKMIKKSVRDPVLRILAVSFISLLLVVVSVIIPFYSITAASLPIKQNIATEPERTDVPPSLIPLFDFTPTFTLYMPLIMGGSGSGGNTPTCNPTAGTGGLPPGIYDTRVANLTATVVVGEGYNPQTPTYLVFYLHGDEGAYSQFQNSGHMITKLVNERGWIFVAPLSPQSQHSWWREPEPQITALAEVFDVMFAQYNVCRNIVLGGVLSGGSIFWSKNFFPNKGGQYPAHTILLCGGGKPKTSDAEKLMALGQNPDIVARSSFKFTYGTEDHLFNDIQNTMALYNQAGFEVIKEELPGVGHCVPEPFTRLKDYLVAKMAELIE